MRSCLNTDDGDSGGNGGDKEEMKMKMVGMIKKCVCVCVCVCVCRSLLGVFITLHLIFETGSLTEFELTSSLVCLASNLPILPLQSCGTNAPLVSMWDLGF